MKIARAALTAFVVLLSMQSTQPGHAQTTWPATISAYESEAVPTDRWYIDTESAPEGDVIAFRKTLMARGARNVNWFYPSLIVCEIPQHLDAATIIGDSRFTARREANMAPAAPGTPTDVAMRAYAMAAVLNDPRLPGPDELGFEDRVMTVSEETRREWEARRPMALVNGVTVPERGVSQNNEFLIGDILVRLIMPESVSGKENWTPEDLTAVEAGAAGAWISYASLFPNVPISFVFTAERQVPTIYEPIDHCSGCDLADEDWIGDVMVNLGFVDRDVQLAVHQYNNQGRARFGTDWAHTFFVASSRNEPLNIFGGSEGGAGYTAYALLGGPYSVIPFPAGANDPNNLGEDLIFSQIYQHEAVHIFWGLDEYPSATSQCSSISGYLAVSNQNKQSLSLDGSIRGCPDYVPCLMWGARNPERVLCRWTAGQMGVADSNNDGILDIFAVPPVIEFEGAVTETVTVSELTVNMKAISVPVPNLNPYYTPEARIDYAAPLRDATLNVNDVGNVKLTPLDGRWDEPTEELRIVLTGITPGLTRVQVSARNTFGATSTAFTKRVYLTAVKYAQFSFGVQKAGIAVQWRTVSEAFGARMELFRVGGASGVEAELLASHEDLTIERPTGSSFTTYSYFDDAVTPGVTYRYFVRGRAVLGDSSELTAESKTFTVTAMLPIARGTFVSQASPNPFRENTSFSVDVPRSFAESQNNSTTFQTLVPTDVEISVFDVAGRRVRELYNGRMFSRVETFKWNGRNDRNEDLPSGVYFIRTKAGELSDVRKVVVVR